MADASAPKIRHEWYQSDNEVVLSVFIKNVKEENLKVHLSARSVSLNVTLPSGADVVFDLDPLARNINPQASSYKVMSTKIEIKLVKQASGVRWGKPEGDEESGSSTAGASMAPSTTKATPSYPSSSKTKKNWDAMAAEIQKEEDAPVPEDQKDKNAGGDRELNKLFQKLYAGATDDQRKAMMKCYQESNGTSLSTSWDEVKKGKVETRPPDSMLARKWEQYIYKYFRESQLL